MEERLTTLTSNELSRRRLLKFFGSGVLLMSSIGLLAASIGAIYSASL